MTWRAQTWPGRAGAQTLVLLHGWLGVAHDWDAVVERLGGRLACVAFDLPGHGDTPWPDADPDLHAAARALAANLADSGIRRYVLAGYSMGGRVALELAVNDPVGCTGLVLVSTSPGIADDAERDARARLDLERAQALEADPAGFVDTWYRQELFGTLAGAVDLRALVARRIAGRDVRGMARALEHLGPGRCPPSWWALHELDMPALVVVGERDERYVAIAEEMATRLSDAHVVRIAGASHAVHLEAPGLLADAVVARFA